MPPQLPVQFHPDTNLLMLYTYPPAPLSFLFQMLVLILFQNAEILEVPDKSLHPHAESIVLYFLRNAAIFLYPAYIVTFRKSPVNPYENAPIPLHFPHRSN